MRAASPEGPMTHDIARRQTLAHLLRRSAKRHPAKTAIVCGAMQWTCCS